MSFFLHAAAEACAEYEEELCNLVLCCFRTSWKCFKHWSQSWSVMMNRGLCRGAITYCCAVSYLVQSDMQSPYSLLPTNFKLLASHNHNEMCIAHLKVRRKMLDIVSSVPSARLRGQVIDRHLPVACSG